MPNKHLNDPQAIYSYDTHEGIHHVVHISTFKIWHQDHIQHSIQTSGLTSGTSLLSFLG